MLFQAFNCWTNCDLRFANITLNAGKLDGNFQKGNTMLVMRLQLRLFVSVLDILFSSYFSQPGCSRRARKVWYFVECGRWRLWWNRWVTSRSVIIARNSHTLGFSAKSVSLAASHSVSNHCRNYQRNGGTATWRIVSSISNMSFIVLQTVLLVQNENSRFTTSLRFEDISELTC